MRKQHPFDRPSRAREVGRKMREGDLSVVLVQQGVLECLLALQAPVFVARCLL